MHPYRPTHGRQPEHVYRLRRAIAATVAIVVLFAVVQLTGLAGGDGDDESATTTTVEVTTTTIPPPPECAEGDLQVVEDAANAWATVLVDTERAIPSSYEPGDLRNIADAGFPLTDGVALRSLVLPDLSALRQAAVDNGTPISILAAFRSFGQQQELYDRRVEELGASEAGSRVARPGHSEHQLGTTIDVTIEGDTDVDQTWGASLTGQWIATNAHKYGFILSYPMEAQGRTCYDYEPWHLRYVGREMAADVIASGLTLREYLWQLNPVPPATTSTTTTTTTTTAAP